MRAAFQVRIMAAMVLVAAFWQGTRRRRSGASYIVEFPGVLKFVDVMGMRDMIVGEGATGLFLDVFVLLCAAINTIRLVIGLTGVMGLKGSLRARGAHCDPVRIAHCQDLLSGLVMVLTTMVTPHALTRLVSLQWTVSSWARMRAAASKESGTTRR